MGELLGLTWDCIDISPTSIELGQASIFVEKELQMEEDEDESEDSESEKREVDDADEQEESTENIRSCLLYTSSRFTLCHSFSTKMLA